MGILFGVSELHRDTDTCENAVIRIGHTVYVVHGV
jgi:hypothetical protein